MHFASTLGVLSLLVGGIGWGPAAGGRCILWPAVPLVGASAAEASFAIPGVAIGPVGAVVAGPHEPHTIYLGSRAGLFRSADGGGDLGPAEPGVVLPPPFAGAPP